MGEDIEDLDSQVGPGLTGRQTEMIDDVGDDDQARLDGAAQPAQPLSVSAQAVRAMTPAQKQAHFQRHVASARLVDPNYNPLTDLELQ